METAVKKKGKPFGFYVCSLGFTFERCAFYTVKYLLAIWIATEGLREKVTSTEKHENGL